MQESARWLCRRNLRHVLPGLLFLVLQSIPIAAAALERTALVVGNNAYRDAPLRNPVNDATDMAQLLEKQLGFEVILRTDVTQSQFEAAAREFRQQLQRRGGVGLFYYAGHGIQVDGHNYLIPVGANIDSETDVKYKAVDAGYVLGQMDEAKASLNIVILDACRDNPYERSFRSASRGLVRLEMPAGELGSLLAYSTAPGKVAADGKGRNSPYTKQLLEALQTPDLTLEQVFKQVAIRVYSETNRRQRPWTSQFLLGDFYPLPSSTPLPSPTGGRKTYALTVATDPADAQVRILNIEQPYAPGIRLAPGNYHIAISRPGYLPQERLVEMKEADRTLTVKLEASPPPEQASLYTLTVDPEPADARVRILNIAQPYQPGIRLPPGDYHIEISKPGYKPQERLVQIENADYRERIKLEPMSQPARLTVRSNVYGDQVYIDGQPRGSTRLDVELEPGWHTVRVEKEGYGSFERRIELGAGGVEVVRAQLQREPSPAPRAGATWTEPVTGTEFVWIEGDCFDMGSPEGEKGRDDDERQHRVCVEGFWLGEHEVTVGDFRRFVEATGYRTEAERSGGCYYYDGEWKQDKGKNWRSPGFEQGDRHPVVCVSWNDAQEYIDWLKGEAGGGYRLPTEAEWEYAARAKTQTARFWGEDPATDKACAYANVADEGYWSGDAHKCKDKYQYTAPVGQLRANDFGLYDMLGNVWEWTCSDYDAAYRGAEQKCASKGSSALRVIRGGAWVNHPRGVRSANRTRLAPDSRGNGVGFRLARTP